MKASQKKLSLHLEKAAKHLQDALWHTDNLFEKPKEQKKTVTVTTKSKKRT